MRKAINNYLKNMPSKKRGHLVNNCDNIIHVLINDNNILELQGLLEHNDFTSELATITQMLYMCKNNIIEYKET
jgi:hypothetical protein